MMNELVGDIPEVSFPEVVFRNMSKESRWGVTSVCQWQETADIGTCIAKIQVV